MGAATSSERMASEVQSQTNTVLIRNSDSRVNVSDLLFGSQKGPMPKFSFEWPSQIKSRCLTHRPVECPCEASSSLFVLGEPL